MRKNRYKLNILGRCTVFVLVFLLITGWLPGAPVFAQTLSAGIPYEQTWTANPAKSGLNKTFEYRITSEDGSPLPEGSSSYYSLKLTGNAKGTKTLNIPFSKPGYYNYKVTPQRTGKSGGYICDGTVYKLMIMVVNSESGLKIGAMTIQDSKKAKYGALKYSQRYYIPSEGGGEEPDKEEPQPGGKKSQKARSTQQTPAPFIIEEEPEEEPDLIGLEEGDIPTTEAILDEDIDHWALLNLILMILTVLISIVDIILYFRRDDEDEENEEEIDEDEERERRTRKKLPFRIATIIPACISVIVFILTEDMRLPMQIVDEWTLWMLIFFVAAAILALLSKKKKQDTDEESG